MFRGYAAVRGMVKTCPLPLSILTEKKLVEYAESFLPYSTGFEIECTKGLNFDINNFKRIPNIMDVDVDEGEQRFRVPSGIKGLICLWEICEQLKINSLLNMGSGIHYHIDFTDVNDFQKAIQDIPNQQKWILKALESWGYTGKFNDWEVSVYKKAVKYHKTYNTVEFRIGEMSFEYELLVKRIIHCQNISRRIKAFLRSLEHEETKLTRKRVEGEEQIRRNRIVGGLYYDGYSSITSSYNREYRDSYVLSNS